MSSKRALAVGCGVAALVAAAIAIAVVAWILHVVQEPKGVKVTVEGPLEVAIDEEFTLTIVIRNERRNRAFGLTDIDLADEYVNNFMVLGTDPAARSSTHVPIDNTRSFSFDHPIPPGGEARYAFRLRPVAVGVFRGDVDVCEGQQFLSALLQTQVSAKP
jgi:hypothetical protein